MSPYEPPGPNVSKKFLVGKLSERKKRQLHRWRLENEPGYRELVEMMQERHHLIVRARKRGLIDWAYDPNHYRDVGTAYCKCGTVDDHNARHDAALASVRE